MATTGPTTGSANERPLIRLARDFVRPYWPIVASIVVLMLAEAGLTGTLAYMLKDVVDVLFVREPGARVDMQAVYWITGGLFGVMAAKALISYLSGTMLARVSLGVINDLQVAMFTKVTHYDLARLNAVHSGQFAAKFLNDATLIRESVTRSIQGAIRDVFTILALMVVMFLQDWRLAAVLTAVLPVTALYTLNLGRKTNKAAARGMEATGDLATHLSETLDGRRVVKAYRMEDHAIARARKIVGERMAHLFKGARARGCDPCRGSFGGCGYRRGDLLCGGDGCRRGGDDVVSGLDDARLSIDPVALEFLDGAVRRFRGGGTVL